MQNEYVVIAAVSGGPDSMALLAHLEGYQIPYIIAHVNYQKRESAFRDEKIVRDWAQKHHRPLWILYPKKCVEGNFQAWARAVRYEFFLDIAHIYGSFEIWLGHHIEDSIETWMLQCQRNSLPNYYGLQASNMYQGLTLVRPFLNPEFERWTKKDFEQFCQDHHIPYGIDESNLTDDYERNRLRHQKIDSASPALRQAWLRQIRKDNGTLRQKRKVAQELMQTNDFSKIQASPFGWLALDFFIYHTTKQHSARKELEDLLQKLATGKKQTLTKPLLGLLSPFHFPQNAPASWMPVMKSWNLQVVNNHLIISPANPIPLYIASLEQLQFLCQMEWSNDFFRFSKRGKDIEAFYVTKEDFPLVIRPFQAKDRLALVFGHKKIARLLRDRKIPAALRPIYPVIEANHEVIFATLAGADKGHYTKLEEDRFHVIQLRAS